MQLASIALISRFNDEQPRHKRSCTCVIAKHNAELFRAHDRFLHKHFAVPSRFSLANILLRLIISEPAAPTTPGFLADEETMRANTLRKHV